ncbi:F-box/kelch-repeat protein At3g23880-like [Trifolium pratense]|nr:F-box/kelch-repeat protein At3g23880-like [Trifolium pratense]
MLQPTTTNTILPDELIDDILLRLPVRSLLRFKSVCKSWKTLITHPKFANIHLRSSTTSEDTSMANKQLIFFTKIEPYVILTYNLKQLFENPSTCAEPVISSFLKMKKYGNYGSCNGLLCLFDRSQCRLKLFNPSIRVKSKKSPQVFPPLDWTLRYYGFGYDQINDKYKFLVVLKDYDNGETLTKIYTFGEDSCKTIQNFPCNSNDSSGEYVSGTLNWIFNKVDDVNGVRQKSILSFDLNKETHREILLPPKDGGKVHRDSKLCVLSNCLCNIVYEESHWVVWLMKQIGVVESWTKLMIIPYEKFRSSSLPFNPIVEPLFISENGVVLLGDKLASKFVLYNLNTGELVYPSLSWEHPLYLRIQLESLVYP